MDFLDKTLELEEFISSPVRTLSLGQRMRADLAASLLHNPKVLYLDEPTIGLDIVVKERIREAIKEINRRYQTTIVLTTHDVDDIEELCDRMIIIDQGKKIYDGKIKEISDTYGYMRTIQVDLKYSDDIEKMDFSKDFNLDEEDLKVWNEDNSLFIKFNKNKVSMPQIVSYAMEKAEVVDINIQETKIEEIIKRIYRNEVTF